MSSLRPTVLVCASFGLMVCAAFALVVILTGCGQAATGEAPSPTTGQEPDINAQVAFTIDDSALRDPGMNAQWIETFDPDGQAWWCLVVGEVRESDGGRGVGIGVHCHERSAR